MDWKWATQPSQAILPSWQQQLDRMTPSEREQTLQTIEQRDPILAAQLRTQSNTPTLPGSRWDDLKGKTDRLLANDLGEDVQHVVEQLQANAKEQEELLRQRQQEYKQQRERVQRLEEELRMSRTNIVALQTMLNSLRTILVDAVRVAS